MLLIEAPPNLNIRFPSVPFPPVHQSLGRRDQYLRTSIDTQRKTKLSVLSVRAGYSRKPTGTSGAYQLIDEETGEKFIVWGGEDDDTNESPIPSKEILNWKPTSSACRENGGESTADDMNTSPKNASAASIGRLKVQHVRALMKRNSHTRKAQVDDSKEMGSEGFSDESDSSESKFEPLDKTTNGLHGREATMDRNHIHIVQKDNTKKPSYRQIAPTKVHSNNYSVTMGRKALNPRANLSLRGWSGSNFPHESMRGSTIISKQQKGTPVGGGFFSKTSFEELGCSDFMIKCLKALLFLRPSHIQAMAYAPVTRGKSCIIADQSGSGKTLAYLAPVIQKLRQEELQGLDKSCSRSPRVIILVPTAELASQVLSNCRALSKFGVPFRSMVATGGFCQKTQLDNLQQDLDVLIATPGRFIYLLQEGFLHLTNLKCAVMDEVDILFGDDGFEQVLQRLIKAAPLTTQFLFVTATLPADIYNRLVEAFPDTEVIMGPGMHRTSSGLEEVLVDCSGVDGQEKTPDTAFLNKKSALLQILKEAPVPRTIIFCNKIETCRKVENILNRYDRKGLQVRALPFHAALTQESRLANMKEFLTSVTKDLLFLVCTDRASRGIDFRNVDQVVLFDFPRDPSEYVRRVGRTARGAGGKGKAFIFVVGKQVAFARRIMERNGKGHPLHNVPAAYNSSSL